VSNSDSKTCPACAEEVKPAAKICRFCRHEFEPMASSANGPAATGLAADVPVPVAAPVGASITGDVPAASKKGAASLALTIGAGVLLAGLGMGIGIFAFDRFATHPEAVEESPEPPQEEEVVALDPDSAVEDAKRHFRQAIDSYFSDSDPEVQMLAADPGARLGVNILMGMMDQPGGGLMIGDMGMKERETLAVWAAAARSVGTDGNELVVGATVDGAVPMRELWSGQGRNNDRVLPAVLLEADLPLVNAVAGRRQITCLRRLSVIDAEFSMERSIRYMACDETGDRDVGKAMQAAGVTDIPAQYANAAGRETAQTPAPGYQDDYSDITNPGPAAPYSGPRGATPARRPSGVIAMGRPADSSRSAYAAEAGDAAEAAAAAARAASQSPGPRKQVAGNQPGFSCDKAGSRAERIICASPDLARRDARLSGEYRQLLRDYSHHSREIQQGQREWLRDVRDRCGDAACMVRAYDDRLGGIETLNEHYSDIDEGM